MHKICYATNPNDFHAEEARSIGFFIVKFSNETSESIFGS